MNYISELGVLQIKKRKISEISFIIRLLTIYEDYNKNIIILSYNENNTMNSKEDVKN